MVLLHQLVRHWHPSHPQELFQSYDPHHEAPWVSPTQTWASWAFWLSRRRRPERVDGRGGLFYVFLSAVWNRLIDHFFRVIGQPNGTVCTKDWSWGSTGNIDLGFPKNKDQLETWLCTNALLKHELCKIWLKVSDILPFPRVLGFNVSWVQDGLHGHQSRILALRPWTLPAGTPLGKSPYLNGLAGIKGLLGFLLGKLSVGLLSVADQVA